MSHPVRVRGLKQNRTVRVLFCNAVAPRAGAWIETENVTVDGFQGKSHPVRVRGLKLSKVVIPIRNFRSHPVRVRGLKQRI